MSVRYPVPQPPRPAPAQPKLQPMRVELLPVPEAAVDIPLLTMPPSTPPGWPRWQ